MRVRLFTLWGLFGFAVGQPLFDLFRRNPAFLVEHEAGLPERALLVMATWVLPGLFAAGLVEIAGRLRMGTASYRILIALLIALTLLPLFRTSLASAQATASALAAGAVIAVGSARWVWLKRSLAATVLAALAFTGLFLVEGAPIGRVHEEIISQRPIKDRSIFLLIFDELPVTNLLREIDEVDAERFPNFWRFAQDAIWFRNAHTANAYTERSVPILLTGRAPLRHQRPVEEDHRPTVFSMLDQTHDFVVSESFTRLCPPEFARQDQLLAGERVRLLLADVGLLWMHWALPDEMRRDLPPVENRWLDYWGLRGARRDPADRFRAWVHDIEPHERPLLGVVHTAYPHNPYVHRPDGTVFSGRRDEPFLERTHWIDDEWAANQAWHRSRLQLQHLDALLGEFLDRVQELGLYDDAVVAVVADHGASYRAGLPFRNPVAANAIDMLAIPMFVKLPGAARGGTIDRRLVSSLDFLPTVFDAAFGSTRWPMHGVSRLDPEAPGREHIELLQPLGDPPLRRIPAGEMEAQRATLARMRSALTPDAGNSFGPFAPLVGRALAELAIGDPQAGEIHLENHGRIVFDELVGSLESSQARRVATDLAIASEQRLLAVTRTVGQTPGASASPWVALLPGGHGLGTTDELHFFAIDAAGVLHPLAKADGPPSLLDRRIGVGATAGFVVDGFYDEAPEGGELCRWSDGRGRLRVPLRADRPAASLRLDLKASSPDGSELEIVVAGRSLLRERIPPGPFSAEIPLPAELQSASTEIELRSTQFVPAERIAGSDDRRRLGVLLRGLWFLSGPVDMP